MSVIGHVVLGLATGGLEQVVLNFVAYSGGKNFRHIIFCLGTGGSLISQAERLKIPLVTLQKRKGIDWRTIFALARLFQKYEVDIVHTHNPGPHFYGLIAAKLAGVPFSVHTKHGRNFPRNKKRVWQNRILAAFTNSLVAVSEDSRKIMVEIEKINPRKTRRIWNGVEISHFTPNPSADTSPVIGTVARLCPEKDQVTLLKAFQLLVKEQPAIRLMIVGGGPCLSDLQKLASGLGILQRVEFLGERFDIPRLLNSFTIFTLSSITEGLPITILEAMAVGLPVVATDVGGNRELVNPPECGLLVPPRNPVELSKAYLELFRNRSLREQMGNAARKRVQKYFGLDRMVSEYELLYSELISNGKR